MNRQEFEHIIKACANVTAGHEFLLIGSQSILGGVPDAPRKLRVSMELDVCPLPFTKSAAAIKDGNMGELARFHEIFRIYAPAVGPETATLPADFRDRLRIPDRSCSCPLLGAAGLSIFEAGCGKGKRLRVRRRTLHYKIIRPSELQRIIPEANVELRTKMEDRLKLVLSKLARRREVIRQQSRDSGQAMSM
jgi:hypothetical protein